MNKIIEVQGLSRSFGERKAVDGISFEVHEGEVFGLLGPNGAGKTTTVRLLNGVLAPSAGTLRVLGFDPMTQGSQVRQQTGVLTETPSLYERLSARENLSVFGALYGVPEERLAARVDEMLDQFELNERAVEKVGGFSKGMKQRLALARALLHDPQLLFLDEPTAGLDPEVARQVIDLVERLSHQKRRTVVLCTHNLDEAQRLCDRVAVLHQGRLLAVGTQQELVAHLWRGQSVTIRCEAALGGPALEQLKRVPGVNQIQIDDALVKAEIDLLKRVPDLVSCLVANGARILEVRPYEHSLEEIYFTLQNQQKESQS
ncbi:MAG TPA: ABC transporter ATP-binding protein [Anaerolineaceae bacterium]|nr:ABC transporter ATP-binding protein [Anaerolineaceae bacterium]